MDSSLGEMAALARVFERYRSQLLLMIQRRMDVALLSRMDPEDILNNAFLSAQKKYAAHVKTPNCTDYAWIYRIVLDEVIDAWRSETRDVRDAKRTLRWPDESGKRFESVLPDDGTSPSEAVDRVIRQEQIRDLLEQLEPDDQEILWMRHFDGLSYEEISSILKVTANAATVRYFRALKRLKKMWKKRQWGCEESW